MAHLVYGKSIEKKAMNGNYVLFDQRDTSGISEKKEEKKREKWKYAEHLGCVPS